MGSPLSRLVACVGTWARADDVSRTTTDRRKDRPVKVGAAKTFTISRFYEFKTFDFGEVISPNLAIMYPRCFQMARNVWLRTPLPNLVARILTLARDDDVSRTTTDRRKRPTRDSRGGEKFYRFIITRIYEFTTLAYEGVTWPAQSSIYPSRCRIYRKVASGFPPPLLVVCVDSWALSDDVSRKTIGRQKDRPAKVGAAKTCLRFYELANLRVSLLSE